jgi:hypothetical protein
VREEPTSRRIATASGHSHTQSGPEEYVSFSLLNILFVFILNIYSLAASSRRCSAQLLIQKSSLLIGVLYFRTKSK